MYFERLLSRVYSLDKQVEIIKSRFVKYSMIGGASALVDWGLFYVFAIILDIHYILSGSISFTLATLFNYFIGIIFLFDSTTRFTKQNEMLLVFLISLIGLAINLFFLFLFSSWFLFSLMGSKILASFFTLVWNFSMRNYYIFKKM